MTNKKRNQESHLSDEELINLVLTEYPYPIAANYKVLLASNNWLERVHRGVELFEFGLRVITLGVLNEYLNRDVDTVNNPILNKLLSQKLSKPTPGTWVEIFFQSLKAYQGKRNIFFMPELYDFYWDTTQTPHKPRKGVRTSFDRLVRIRNDHVKHGISPTDESKGKALAQEILNHINTILARFSFLQHYDVIRILNRQEGNYTYERYTGLNIITDKDRLTSKGQLKEGWFYLRRDDCSVLNLHPLFIFSPKEIAFDKQITETRDAALYEKYTHEITTIKYITTVLREYVSITARVSQDSEIIDEFRNLIFNNLKHKKMGQQRQPMNWSSLRYATKEITTSRMGGAKIRYQRGLYLQREDVYSDFQDFISSNKCSFVLIGNSGVGKSNFIFSLIDEYSEKEDICILAYDAAHISASNGIVRTIINDLQDYLIIGKDKIDILKELNRRGIMEGRTLLIIFDAINENENPRELLREINTLLANIHYRWLKILITSRPQSWYAMKKGLRLAEEHYYRKRGSDDVEIKMDEFTIKLEPFEYQELALVYEKYKLQFNLQTGYENMDISLHRILRNPLVLRLVAENYRGKTIPDSLHPSQIYKEYIKALEKSGRLFSVDIRFLEHELMPLIISRGHYDNKLTAQQIDEAHTSDGRQIWELIHNDGVDSNGVPVNDSFRRLVDTGILTSPKTSDEDIGFTYERFYEYFAGRMIHKLSKQQDDSLPFYADIINELPDKLFLWGALIQAINNELFDGNTNLFFDLALMTGDNRLLRNALVEALLLFGELRQLDARNIIWELLGRPTPKLRNFISAFLRMIRSTKEAPEPLQSKQIIAIEAAARLKFIDVLVTAAIEPNPALRALSAQNTFYLWTIDREQGLKVLENLSRRITSSGLPDLDVADSMLAITGAILGGMIPLNANEEAIQKANEETLQSLFISGRRAVQRMLKLEIIDQKRIPGRIHHFVIQFVYRLIINGILRFATRIMSQWEARAWASIEGLEHVFTLEDKQKKLLKSFLPYLEPGYPGLEGRIDDMIDIEDWGDMLGQAIVELPLLSLASVDLKMALDIGDALTDYALWEKPPSMWLGGPQWNIFVGALRNMNAPPDQQKRLVKQIERAVRAIQKDPNAWLERAQRERPVPISSDSRVSFLGLLSNASYEFDKKAVPAFVEKCLYNAKEHGDHEYLNLFIEYELNTMLDSGEYKCALLNLKTIAGCNDESVQDTIVEFLVRARHHNPELVDDMLLRGEFPQNIVKQVFAQPIQEHYGDLATYQLAFIFYDLFILGPSQLREELQWILGKALEVSSFNVWISLIAKELINLIADAPVFDMPADAPSRRMSIVKP